MTSVKIETHGRSHGPDLVLLHGWGLNGAVWNEIARTLMQDFTLHIVDYAGEQPVADPQVSWAALAGRLLLQLPPQFHLLGWSLGGQLAMTLALRAPQRIQSLVLVSATPRFTHAPDWPHAMAQATLDDFATRLQSHYRPTLRSFLALQALNLPHAKTVVAMLQNAMSLRSVPSPAQLAASLQWLQMNDLREQVQKIAQPALILQGDRDMLTPEPAARWLAKALAPHPQSRYVLIPGCAHAPFLSHPELFIQYLKEFLLP